MSDESPSRPARSIGGFMGRRFGDLLLFGVTAIELSLLLVLTPTFTLTDWIYVCSNVLVLVIALTRRPAQEQDRSMAAAVAVFVSYTYTYAQVAVVNWYPGEEVWPAGSLPLVIIGACMSL